ncbi:hypothetical protein CEXT_191991 [Caerostris extrusa]|uniref:Uncharacterized protein n=1 Tax=Caerostris extrusa TaxID=172846 RepID=A0AAV4UWJ1_CAEEX|nr:hypothetical protein CEXT_191991 [Caerostris extrusa]
MAERLPNKAALREIPWGVPPSNEREKQMIGGGGASSEACLPPLMKCDKRGLPKGGLVRIIELVHYLQEKLDNRTFFCIGFT